jgi:hypothetical protein
MVAEVGRVNPGRQKLAGLFAVIGASVLLRWMTRNQARIGSPDLFPRKQLTYVNFFVFGRRKGLVPLFADLDP